MTRLIVHSARISYGGPDRLDVTRRAIDQARKRGEPSPPGAPWAPSWGILQPVIEARHRANAIGPLGLAALDAAWSVYVEGYLAEMRVSYSHCDACAGEDPEDQVPNHFHTCEANRSGRLPSPRVGLSSSWQDPSWGAAWYRGARSSRPDWTHLLFQPRVVLVCYCSDPEHCHRFLLRARILPALGAVDGGELLQEAA